MKESIYLFSKQNHSEIQAIFQPLKRLGVDFFQYTVVFQDSHLAYLTNSPDRLHHILTEEECYGQWDSFEELVCQKNTLYLTMNKLFDLYTPEKSAGLQQRVEISSAQFNLHDFFTVSKKCQKTVEHWWFATSGKKAAMFDIYASYPGVFEQFIACFRDKGHALLEAAKGYRLPVQIYNKKQLDDQLSGEIVFTDEITGLDFKQVYLDGQAQPITRRQLECLHCIARGQTLKVAAKNLQLSPRTVESYLNEVMMKWQLDNRLQLITLYWEQGLDKLS